jgi:hypothetical protein
MFRAELTCHPALAGTLPLEIHEPRSCQGSMATSRGDRAGTPCAAASALALVLGPMGPSPAATEGCLARNPPIALGCGS